VTTANLDIASAIRERFGLTPRPPQVALVERIVAGQSALGIMPTGAGKSLTYQAAAALLPGLVVVVSPLISLMRDQVEKTRAVLRTARLDSTLDRTEANDVLRAIGRNELDLLYVAPERLANERFQAALGRAEIAVLAVDEAHCISAWGHDFRPDYLRLPLLRVEIGSPPVLALTATAPLAVQADIRATLGIPDDGTVNTGARRPNLALRVEVPEDRAARLLELVEAEPDAPTIVYAFRQADTERIASWLSERGIRARAYHAGLEPEQRADVQDGFLADAVACVVATIAFGMGVDKPNVRRVIHAHAPRSLEGYIQEVGRAGRDGAPAVATLLYDDDDRAALTNFVDAKAPDDEQVRGALNMAFTSRESDDVIAFSPYEVGDQHDMDPVAVRTLLARLELRGVVRALTPAFDSYQVPRDHDPATVAGALGGEDGELWECLIAGGKVGRTWTTFSVRETARRAKLPHEALLAVVRRVEEEGLAQVRTSGVLHRYRVLRRPDRATDTPYLLESVRAGIESEHRRSAAVRGFVLERDCRQAHALRYLGDADLSPCGVCDLCRGAAPIEPGQAAPTDWRAGFDPALIRGLAARGADAIGIARALCQVTTPRSRAYRRDAAWGRLERAPYADVLALVHAELAG